MELFVRYCGVVCPNCEELWMELPVPKRPEFRVPRRSVKLVVHAKDIEDQVNGIFQGIFKDTMRKVKCEERMVGLIKIESFGKDLLSSLMLAIVLLLGMSSSLTILLV